MKAGVQEEGGLNDKEQPYRCQSQNCQHPHTHINREREGKRKTQGLGGTLESSCKPTSNSSSGCNTVALGLMTGFTP